MQSTEFPVHIDAAPAALPATPSLMSRVFSYPLALAFALTTLTVLTISGRFNDPDLWWHLKVGEIAWTTHTLPSFDTFSFTAPNHPWPAHEWLGELTMYAAYKAGGYSGLMVWFSAFASLAFLVVFVLGWLRSGNPVIGLRGAVIAWFFGTTGLSTRPQVMGYGFLAAVFLLLELARTRNSRWLWGLPPLFALWVNCHASYALGLGVVALYFASTFVSGTWGLITADEENRCSRKEYAIILAACTVALCLNPVGVRLLLFPFEAVFEMHASLNMISEWLPPDTREARALGMLGTVVGIFALCMATRRTISVRESALLLIAGTMAIQHTRMLFPFGIMISPILCQFGVPRRRNPGILGANLVMIACCVAAMWHFFPSHSELEEQVRKSSPVDAVKYIKAHQLTGPMLNDYGQGGYLIWALPEVKVFVDGRAEIYDSLGVVDAYRRWAYLEEDPKLLLEKYHINFCLLTAESPMNKVLPYIPGWKKVYSDGVASVFSR